jgi:hypothetical protein
MVARVAHRDDLSVAAGRGGIASQKVGELVQKQFLSRRRFALYERPQVPHHGVLVLPQKVPSIHG